MENILSIDYKDWYINQKRIPDIASDEYESFFAFHKRLCIEGCYMNGTFINPFLMWHLNFWHTEVDVLDERGRINQKYACPYLRDNEWIVTNEIERAHNEHKGLVIGGIRRMAKSVIEASYIGWGATFDENSQNVIAGLNSPDIKLITDKLDKGLNFLPEAWRWQRVEDNWKNQVTLGIKTKIGERIPFSQILIRNLADGVNEEAIAGTKPRKLIIDEGGKGSFLRALQAAIPGFTTPFGWTCSPIITFTGGDMTKFMDAKSLMFDVGNYNFLTYKNEKDENRTHGLFMSFKYRMESKDISTLGHFLDKAAESPLHKVPMWISNEEKALKITNDNLARLKKAGDRVAYLKEKMYYPIEVDDIFSNEDTNIFDIEACKRQKAKLLAQERTGTPVILYEEDGKVKHQFTDKLPISNFPLKPTDNKDAPAVIWEFPPENPAYGLYTAGCLLPGEKVLTEKGLQNVEYVTLNNNLVNKDGELVIINNLQKYYKNNEEIYTMKVSNSQRTTTFTKEHPIYVSDAHGNNAEPVIENRFDFNFLEIKGVKENQWIKIPNIYKQHNNFDIDILWNNINVRIDRQFDSPLKNKDFWWLVGLFLGDGWCESNNTKITFSFNIKEKLHFVKFVNIVETLFDRSVSYRTRSNCIEASFSCKQLHDFLSLNFGKFAGGKYISEWAKKINDESKYELILGYLDSDGCIMYDKKRKYYGLDFVSINLTLLEGVQDILFSLGYVSGINVLRQKKETYINNRIKKSKIQKTYQLRMGHNYTIEFSKHFITHTSHKLKKIDITNIISTVASPKKGCFISSDKKYIYFKITKIEKSIYTGWVYNFDCDTHTYMCHRITTHNCDSYRQGQARYSESLGTIYIYKRMHSILEDKYQDMFVASYAARPDKKDKWEEQARLLIKYYNARTLVENDEISFIDYMVSKGDAHYLEKQPEWIKEIVPNTTVTREYGLHRSAEKIRNFLHTSYKKYQEEIYYIEKDEEGNIIKQVTGVNKIFDPMLLEETIQYNETDNFDRIVAAELAIVQAMKMDSIIGKIQGGDDARIKSLYVKRNRHSLFAESRGMFNKLKRKLFN